MPNKRQAVSVLPDLVEATEAIKHITKALGQDIQRRAEPSRDFNWGKIQRELTEARLHIQSGASQLEPGLTSNIAERIALQKALLALVLVAEKLGEVL